MPQGEALLRRTEGAIPELQKVPMAVIGVGEHGKRHAHALKRAKGAELAGVYDRDHGRADAVATELGVKAFGSLEETLESAEAVSIVIPTTEHAAMARLAMEAGKDALLEKPIARTLEEADELIEIADRTGRILQVGHLERFNPGALAAKAVTHQPLFFEIHRLGVFSPRSLDVDVVFDLMIHDLDLVLWLANAQVRDVRAVGLPVLTDRVDIANARVEFENGAVANFTASRVSTEKVRKFRYFQPHEYISIDFSRRDALLLSVGNDAQNPQIAFRKLEVQNTDPLEAELESFANCVRTRRPPVVGGREGRAALALAEKVMFCIEEHASRVKVPLTRPAGHSGEL
ncbi:MAG TPA: Gfo/Idh/MocA family oxidoreductase [Terriglobia bacterium]|nr:Gfo/Idh/MocA family oxidoreductase [Terriglobia bacterium]